MSEVSSALGDAFIRVLDEKFAREATEARELARTRSGFELADEIMMLRRQLASARAYSGRLERKIVDLGGYV